MKELPVYIFAAVIFIVLLETIARVAFNVGLDIGLAVADKKTPATIDVAGAVDLTEEKVIS